jgi:hypothetical protein
MLETSSPTRPREAAARVLLVLLCLGAAQGFTTNSGIRGVELARPTLHRCVLLQDRGAPLGMHRGSPADVQPREDNENERQTSVGGGIDVWPAVLQAITRSSFAVISALMISSFSTSVAAFGGGRAAESESAEQHRMLNTEAAAKTSANRGEAAPVLAPGWQQEVDPRSGRTFYVNHASKQWSWDAPLVENFPHHAKDDSHKQSTEEALSMTDAANKRLHATLESIQEGVPELWRRVESRPVHVAVGVAGVAVATGIAGATAVGVRRSALQDSALSNAAALGKEPSSSSSAPSSKAGSELAAAVKAAQEETAAAKAAATEAQRQVVEATKEAHGYRDKARALEAELKAAKAHTQTTAREQELEDMRAKLHGQLQSAQRELEHKQEELVLLRQREGAAAAAGEEELSKVKTAREEIQAQMQQQMAALTERAEERRRELEEQLASAQEALRAAQKSADEEQARMEARLREQEELKEKLRSQEDSTARMLEALQDKGEKMAQGVREAEERARAELVRRQGLEADARELRERVEQVEQELAVQQQIVKERQAAMGELEEEKDRARTALEEQLQVWGCEVGSGVGGLGRGSR